MPAFSDRYMENIVGAYDSKVNRMFSKMALVMSGEEFISGFIYPEHVDILKKTEEIVGLIGNTGTHIRPNIFPDSSVWMSFQRKAAIILPKYVEKGLRPDAPIEIVNKFNEWVNERYNLGIKLGDALDAMKMLNDMCHTPQVFAMLFPAITAILSWVSPEDDSKERKMAEKLTTLSNVSGIPALPREVKVQLLELSSLVQTISLTAGGSATDAPEGYARFFDFSHRRSDNTFFTRNRLGTASFL